MKKASGAIRLDLAQYREMEVFTQISSDLDYTTKRQLSNGQGLMQLLRQGQYRPLAQYEQVIILVAALNHVMQDIPLEKIDAFRQGLLTYAKEQAPDLCRRLEQTGQMSDDDRQNILKLSRGFLTQFQEAAVKKRGE